MADDDEDCAEERVRALMEREAARTAELAERIGIPTRREALIVQALFDPPDHSVAVPLRPGEVEPHQHNEWPAFRDLFEHRLVGADDELLERVRGVVRLACEAVEVGDVDGLRIVAELWDRQLGIAGKHAKVLSVVRILEDWLQFFEERRPTDEDALARSLPVRFYLANLLGGVSEATFRELIAETRAVVGHTRGYGKKNARGLASWLIYQRRAFGVTSEKTADTLVGSALKTRNVAVENS